MTIQSTDIDASDAAAFEFSASYQQLVIKPGVTVMVEGYRVCVIDWSYNGSTLVNHGTITSPATGVDYESNATSFSLINAADGTINGNDAIVVNANSGSIANYGAISSSSYCIYIQNGSSNRVTNAGIIQGGSTGIIGGATATSLVVSNSGTIIDSEAVSLRGDHSFFTNTGTVVGTVYVASNGSISNAGVIADDVSFASGTNVFNGRGGTVDGTITGGTGVDRILAGNDGEILDGGAGHDRLVGGTGADTFVFSSYSSADSDVVKSFNVSNDTIQFDSTVFKHLVADQTPAFAIGTKATSATDFLFYNSGTGNLYYDVDGNKTAHTPFLVANLGTGLHLTANDFAVV